MQELIDLLDEATGQAQFDAGRVGIFATDGLRNLHRQQPMLVGLARTQLPEPMVAEIATLLGALLRNHIEGDRVGNGLAFFLRGMAPLGIKDLALDVVRASAILSPREVVKLLADWENGNPIPFRSHVVLDGVSVEQSLETPDGIQFERLPPSSVELQAQLPEFISADIGIMRLAGKAKLIVANTALSAIFREEEPTIDEYDNNVVSGPRIYSDKSLDLFCKSLTLVCNNHISWRIAWSECDAWGAFGQRKRYVISHDSSRSPHHPVMLDQETLSRALDLLEGWLNGESANARLDLAIDRWMMSKSNRSNRGQVH